MKIKKGIYILPSLFTLGNMFCGFYVILTVLNQAGNRFLIGPLLLFLAIFLDGLDGKIARLTNTDSDFGVQLDSISDIISFGIAPAFLLFSWGISIFGRFGIGGIFLFIAAGAMRLARFNLIENQDRRYFTGLPIPAAAGCIAIYVLKLEKTDQINIQSVFMLIMVYILSLLMVSKFKYKSFKDINLKEKKPFNIFVLFIFIFFLITLNPTLFFLVSITLFILTGPFRYFIPVDEGLMGPGILSSNDLSIISEEDDEEII